MSLSKQIIPLFVSEYSLKCRSILTLEKPDEIKERSPVSILSIAAKYNIAPAYLIENSLTGYAKAYKNFKDAKRQFVFGLRLIVVNDINDKSPESLKTESKIVILLNNSEAYTDIIKIFSVAATEGKYYVPRICWKKLKSLWTKNLTLAIPMYDGFIHANLLQNQQCIPDFPMEPVFFKENHNLPFDKLLQDATVRYSEANGNEIVDTHTIYYFKNKDVKAYQTYRCIDNRSTLSKPNLEYFGSDEFSFESYRNLIGESL